MNAPQTTYENLIHTTVRIEARLNTGQSSTGTGFVFSRKTEKGNALFVVTNKHVVKDATEGLFVFNKVKDGGPDYGNQVRINVPQFQQSFMSHPDPEVDVAVFPLAPLLHSLKKSRDIEVFFKAISDELIWSDETISKRLDAIEEVLIFGYPNGIYDEKNLTPVTRKGITATPPAIDFNGKPVFLIDASIFPGSSGSPVFLCNVGSYLERGRQILGGGRIALLGLVSSVFIRQDLNTIQEIEVPTHSISVAKSEQMIDIGIVFKAHTIVEAIDAFLSSFESLQKAIG